MPDLHVVQNMPLLGRRLRLAGRLDVAIDWWMALFILGVVVVPSACFLSTVPFHPSLVGYYTTLGALLYSGILLAMACSSVLFLVITVVCDPGFVFPAGWSARRSDNVQSMEREFDPALDVHYCRVCQLFVERYDHHCGIVGACVGRRNMWSFVMFCSSVAVMCALSVPASICFLGMNMILPTSFAAVTIHGVLQLFSTDIVKVFIALFGAFYGGGYCAMLAVVYWRYVLSDTHSLAKRRRLRLNGSRFECGGNEDAQQANFHVAHEAKDFSWLPHGAVNWRAVREVFVEYRRMELTATALGREVHDGR